MDCCGKTEPSSVTLTATRFEKSTTTKETFCLSREEVQDDMSFLQSSWDKEELDRSPEIWYEENPPQNGLRSENGIVLGLHHERFLDPSTRATPTEIFSSFSPEAWKAERARMTKVGYTVARMTGDSAHEVWLKVERDGRVTRFSTTEHPGCELYDMVYYDVRRDDKVGHDCVRLIPRLLTGTNLFGTNTCFVYFHLKPRNPPPLTYVQKVHAASKAIVERPLALRDFLDDNSDQARLRVMAPEMQATESLAGTEIPAWIRDSSVLVATFSQYVQQCLKVKQLSPSTRDAFARVKIFVSSESARNRLQDAFQYLYPDHPACVKEAHLFEACSPDLRRRAHVDIAAALCQLIPQADAAWALEQRQRAHDAREKAEREAERDKTRLRKEQAARARASKLAAGSPPLTQRREPPKSAKKAARGNSLDAASGLEHAVFILSEQRALRQDAFDVAQQQAHRAALAAKAKARQEADAKLARDVGAAHEAANHVVPAPPVLSAYMP